MVLLRMWLAFATAASAAGGSPAAAPEAPLPYTDTSSAVALRNMQKIGARDPATLTEAEGVEWVRSRFAWVALLRLQGKDPYAVEVFEGCGSYCAKWGPSAEWGALRKWGCARKPNSEPCRQH